MHEKNTTWVDITVLKIFTRGSLNIQRLAARDLDNWEQRRVPRPPGEQDGGF
jgi:hypothetical protein